MMRCIAAAVALAALTLAGPVRAQPASPGLCTKAPGFVGCAKPLANLTRSSMLLSTTGDTDGAITPAQLFNLLVPGDVTPLLTSGLPSLSLIGMGPRAPLFIQNNTAPGAGGQSKGLQIITGSALTATPGAGDNIAFSAVMTNENGRQQLWTASLAALQVPGNTDGLVRVVEIELNNLNTSVQPDAFTGAAPYRKNGIEIVGHNTSTARLTAAAMVWANDTTGVKWWDSGIQLSRVATTGIKAVRNPGGITDAVEPFQNAFLWDASNSLRVLRVDGTHNSLIDASNAVDFGIFLRGLTTANTNVLMRNFADFDLQLILDSGATATKTVGLLFGDQGVGKWLIQKNNGNGLFFTNMNSGNSIIALQGEGLYLLVNGALKQVVTGAVDSGGTGFRTLRVAN